MILLVSAIIVFLFEVLVLIDSVVGCYNRRRNRPIQATKWKTDTARDLDPKNLPYRVCVTLENKSPDTLLIRRGTLAREKIWWIPISISSKRLSFSQCGAKKNWHFDNEPDNSYVEIAAGESSETWFAVKDERAFKKLKWILKLRWRKVLKLVVWSTGKETIEV
jgi:hypothetical protein